MKTILIKDARIVNEGRLFSSDLLVKGGYIDKIAPNIDYEGATIEIDASGQYLMPGLIDDQVHFRQPGNMHKGNIYTESKAAVAGGVTSYMEMPNTTPAAVTNELLEEKYYSAGITSLANYSFYLGASNDNLEEIKRLDPKRNCGVKAFLGSSTGDLLLDDMEALRQLFLNSPTIIAAHSEDEATVRANNSRFKDKYGYELPANAHALIRDEEACFICTDRSIKLAKETGARFHVLHISTAKELALFESGPLKNKKITSEACVHHLWFSDEDYERLGNQIKCNPAIKSPADREAIFQAVLADKIDVIATDHAPHTVAEKSQHYWAAPSGLPLVQHSLLMMLDHHLNGKISLEEIARKMAHAPADLFDVHKRGYIREGYYADMVLVKPNSKTEVRGSELLYKCKWSPLEGHQFGHEITHTFVNGNMAYRHGQFDECVNGQRLLFDR